MVELHYSGDYHKDKPCDALFIKTTVGYGDVVPVTAVGKVIAIACALTGILAIALPVPAIINRFQEEQDNVAGQKQLANLPENERFLTKLFLTPMKNKQ